MVNVGKNNYRDNIISKLIAEGYELDSPASRDLVNCDLIRDQIKQTCQENYQQYCQAVPQVETPSDSELEALSNKRTKTQEERYRERKGQLIKRYGVEVLPELVEKDDRGWYPQLQLHYYLTVGNIYLAERDRRSLSQLKKQGNNKIFKPDINKRQLSAQIRGLQLIGIEQFLNPDAEFTKDSLADWFEMVVKWRFEIKSLLGVNINPERDSAIAVVQRILRKLGLRLELKHQIRINGKPTRVYQGCNLNPDERVSVFDNWLERDLSQFAVTPFFKEDLYTGVVAA